MTVYEDRRLKNDLSIVVLVIDLRDLRVIIILNGEISCSILKVSKILACPMFWGLIAL